MAIKQKEYLVPILRVLLAAQVPLSTNEIEVKVYSFFEFNKDDCEDMGYGHSRRYKNLNWAKTTLKKRGLIEQIKHGVWNITNEGKEALKKTENI